jgi:hypothetical protein
MGVKEIRWKAVDVLNVAQGGDRWRDAVNTT